MNTTHLDRLEVKNFRSYSDFQCSFHPRLNVLVAPNGGGKTAVLDAIAVSLRSFVDGLQQSTVSHGFANSDIRLQFRQGKTHDVCPTVLSAEATIDGRATTWTRTLGARGGKTTRVGARQLTQRAEDLRRDLSRYVSGRSATPPTLPVITYYGTGRLWREHKQTSNKARTAGDLSEVMGAYLDALSPDSSFSQFRVWFEALLREAQNERYSGTPSPHRPQLVLKAVRSATDALLVPSGWGGIDLDYLRGALFAVHPELGRLDVAQLSDGVQNILSLVADLAHRCARLNAHYGEEACTRSPGIVLIDEVDMHLHPGWQQQVIPALTQAFPQVQFILTTHSPQVLSTVPRECIRILERSADGSGRAREPDQQTGGVESALVMAVVMGVDPVPNTPEVAKLRTLEELIGRGDYDGPEARLLLDELRGHYGSLHSVVLGLEKLIRWERFRRESRRSGKD